MTKPDRLDRDVILDLWQLASLVVWSVLVYQWIGSGYWPAVIWASGMVAIYWLFWSWSKH